MIHRPIAFLSYARFDDQHESGRLSELCKRLSGEVRVQTGEPFSIFQDRTDIAWGQEWRARIEESLDAVTFLIPILTPSFFKSTACRGELERFLGREQRLRRRDLVLAIHYITCPSLLEGPARQADPLAQVLADRQHSDWRELRFEHFTAPQVGRALARMAEQIGEALGRSSPAPGFPGAVAAKRRAAGDPDISSRSPGRGSAGEASEPGRQVLVERIARIRQAAHDVFTPSAPVLEAQFLEGRKDYLGRIERARRTLGRSIVVHGPPAAGKTSLLKALKGQVFYRSVDRGNAWGLVLRTVLTGLGVMGLPDPNGASPEARYAAGLLRRVTPDEAAERLAPLDQLVIIDDFENVKPEDRSQCTELIKKLSNRQAHLTLLLAGQAGSLADLLPDYNEVQRVLTPIEILPLGADDLARIVDEGFPLLDLGVEEVARDYILGRSFGLAHIVHQYCLDCVYALEERIQSADKHELTIGIDECRMAEPSTVG